MEVNDIMQLIDEILDSLSAEECINILKDIASEVDARIEAFETDIENS